MIQALLLPVFLLTAIVSCREPARRTFDEAAVQGDVRSAIEEIMENIVVINARGHDTAIVQMQDLKYTTTFSDGFLEDIDRLAKWFPDHGCKVSVRNLKDGKELTITWKLQPAVHPEPAPSNKDYI